MEDGIYSQTKKFRLKPSEAKILSEKSQTAGMSESEYLRLLILQKPDDYPEIRKLLKELINEVNRIGVNINQITFRHNAGFYSEADKISLKAYMQKLNREVKKVVELIGNQ